MRHNNNINNYKLFLNSQNSPQKLFIFISNPINLQKFNKQVQQIHLKHFIYNQNIAIIYQKNKSYSKLYKARDFLYLRHVFKQNQNRFIVDVNIELENYPPFLTITRGFLQHQITGIFEQGTGSIVIMQIQIKNLGYLTNQQDSALTMLYIQEMTNINNFLQKKQIEVNQLFNLEFNNSKKENFKQFNINYQQLNKSQQISYYNQQQIQKQYNISYVYDPKQIINKTLPQIKENQSLISLEKIPIIDINQNVLNNYEYLYKKHQTNIKSVKQKLLPVINGHHLWKGQWKVDENNGGIIFINQKKIQQQKNVISYILNKIGKNLLSGKSIMNISLPVDIFYIDSNLQRFARTFSYAPKLLQNRSKAQRIQQFKSVVSFGFTTSMLYLQMQKPFNPVIGQTFQGWINGCPVYLQQISHHPSIASFYMIGRGYSLRGSYQSKMSISLNSGTGTNQGQMIIEFKQSQRKFYFQTPGGLLSGIAYGNRKFNLVNKGYCYSDCGLFCEIVFNPHKKKGFFSVGKPITTSDYFEGKLYQVNLQFIQSFRKNKKQISIKQIKNMKGTFNGIWHKYILFNDQKVIEFDKQIGFKLEYQMNRLPSDSYYREDIAFRIFNQKIKSQIKKEKIENQQRIDTKLRLKNIKNN